MKKLIAISVVFALVAGAAFAADIGVDVKGGVNLIKGDTGKKATLDKDGKAATESNKPTADGGMSQFRISASGEDDNGTFGAFFRYDADWGNGRGANVAGAQGHAWWKPIDQLKLLIGGGPDGRFEQSGVTRWNFYQVAGDVGVAKESWKHSDSFYGGWEDAGLDLIITPSDGLEVNLGIPYMTKGWQEVADVYLSSTLQIAYTADGLGTFAFTYKSGKGNKDVDPTQFEKKTTYTYSGGTWDWDPDKGEMVYSGTATPTVTYEGTNGKNVHDPGQLWVFAGLTMIENLEIDIGLGYTLPKSGKGLESDYQKGKFEGSINDPIAFGLGAHYNAGDFGVKARTQVKLAGKVAPKDVDTYKIPMNIIFDVLPYYNINESLAFLFSAGIDYTAKSGNEIDKETSYAITGFHVLPYITIKSSWWAPNFYAGIDIRTDGVKHQYEAGKLEKDGSTTVNWSVPLGIAVSF